MSGRPERVAVAVILGAHGVRGEARVKSLLEDAEACFALGPLADADGAVLLTPQAWRPAKTHFIVQAKETRSKEAWDALKGQALHALRDALPPPEEDEVFADDLIGLAVFDPQGSAIGRVAAVQDFGAGDLLEIAPDGGGKTVLVPFTAEDVPEFDIDARRLVIADFALWAAEE